MPSNASVGARLGLVAAAIVAVVLLGAVFLNPSRNGATVGAPATQAPATTAPTSQPTTALTPPASAAASAAAGPPTLKNAAYAPCNANDTVANTCIAPGTYQLNNWPGPGTWPATVTINVPASWFEWDADAGFDGVLVVDGDPNIASGWGVMFTTVGDVSRDPCNPGKGVIPAAQVNTPQKLAAAMAAWPQFKATAPQPITVDGHTGLKLQLTSTGPNSCRDSGVLWKTTTGGSMNVYPEIGLATSSARAPGTFEIVDTGNGLLVIRTTDFPQTTPTELDGRVAMNATRHAKDQTALHAILNSIKLTPLSP